MTVAWQDVTGALLPPLWRASWQAAVLAILVLCVQRLLGPRLPARWRYNLWALVLLRLLLPVTPQAPFSLFNLAPDLATPRVTPAGAVPVAPRIELSPDAAPTERVAPAARPIPWLALLAAAWCFGALVLLARIAVSSVRLARMVRQMSAVTDEGVASLLRGAAADMNVRRPPALLVSRDLAAPALMGFRRPRLLLPAHVL
ncbi:MAG TPA: M56 family metallopeptidase, partial [Tepidisphaeraceae bacterium]|nr:M56 family metallopeptidase [Tepidisphaeraceae bacterium]